MSNFIITYEAVTPRKMRINLTPKGYIFIYNVTFNFTTKTFTGIHDYAANGYRFSEANYAVSKKLVWFLIKAPSLSDTEKSIIDGVSKMSDTVISITTLPFMQ